MSLTREAKKLLAETIRGLREKLLLAIHDEAERRYHLSVPLRKAGLDEAPSAATYCGGDTMRNEHRLVRNLVICGGQPVILGNLVRRETRSHNEVD
jgi:hypothetical protein